MGFVPAFGRDAIRRTVFFSAETVLRLKKRKASVCHSKFRYAALPFIRPGYPTPARSALAKRRPDCAHPRSNSRASMHECIDAVVAAESGVTGRLQRVREVI
jgi:hypothetical protein